MSDVLVVGGGFAGLAAAVDLARRGRRPILLERRPFLGGRAYSFTDRQTGDEVDNGQHLFLGAYRETRAFLAAIGATHKLRFQEALRVDFALPGRPLASLRCPPLPAPWNLAAGLARLGTLSFRDRWGMARAVRALERARRGVTVEEWLCDAGQGEAARRRFWEPLCLATLNEEIEVASAHMLRRVLEEGLLAGTDAARIGFASTGLSTLYTHDARRAIEARGGEVMLSAEVRALHVEGGRARGVVLEDGRRLEAGGVLCAVPFARLAQILPDGLARDPFFRPLSRLVSSPIVSVHLWLDRPVLEADFAGLLGGTMHWAFDRRRMAGGRGPAYVSLVASAARSLALTPKPDLVFRARADLERHFPAARGVKVVHARVVKELEATLSPRAGDEDARLPAETPLPGLWLAGDWTDTDLPATIEGAVRSGHRAAALCDRFLAERRAA